MPAKTRSQLNVGPSTSAIKKEIRDKWTSGTSPISYSGITNVMRHYPGVSQKVIEDALAGIDTYTLFRPEKKPKNYNPIYIRDKRKLFQADLVDMKSREKYNDGVKYLLAVIDAYTRFAWIEPIKNKTGPAVLTAFKKIAKRVPDKMGELLLTDSGSEFIYGPLTKFLTSQGVTRVPAQEHAYHVERFNRTIKTIIRRYMEERQTNTYINKLEELLRLYNTRYHRIIKMSPQKAEKSENRDKLLENVNEYYKKAAGPRKKPRFKVGDLVRISAFKSPFHKGYELTFKPQLYRISEVNTKMPVPMYRLKFADKEGKPEAGSWYESQLQLVSQDVANARYKIEKILKKRTTRDGIKQVLVKWLYWPSKFNTWEAEDGIENV